MALAADDDDDPGELFHLHERVGDGSYGTVFRGRNRATDAEVAVKVVEVDEGAEDAESLRREIDILRNCSSPFIVNYIGSYLRRNELYIVMEYCAAGSVSDLIGIVGKPLDGACIRAICSAVLLGLDYLHHAKAGGGGAAAAAIGAAAAGGADGGGSGGGSGGGGADGGGIIHRDVKAGNILLTRDGRAKLADFGVSAQLNNTMSKRATVIGSSTGVAPRRHMRRACARYFSEPKTFCSGSTTSTCPSAAWKYFCSTTIRETEVW